MQDTLKIDFSLIFENMTAGLCVVKVVEDKSGNPSDFTIVETNSRFEEIAGTNNLIGSSILLMCPDVKSECIELLKRVHVFGESGKLEIYRPDIDKYLIVKVFRPKKEYVGILVTDITEQKRAEEKLIESEHSFRSLYENVAGGVLIVDEDYVIRDVNERTCEITGYKKHELVGHFCDIICPKGMTSKKCPIWEEKKSGFIGMDTYVKGKGGVKTPIIKDAKRLTIRGKQCIFENFHDITEQKNAENELRIAKEKAEESNRLKSAFLANVSHEIRTPMNGILGFADLLREPQLSGEIQQKYIQVIERSGKRMLNIINDLIDISKIEAGQIELFYGNVNVNSVLSEQFSFFKLEAESKGLKLIYNKIEDSELEVITDIVRLNQILCNLLNMGKLSLGVEETKSIVNFI
jgi:PAS domain S-box-containing protein